MTQKNGSKEKSEARKLIPARKVRGRRKAQEEQAVIWICVAAESFGIHGEKVDISPVICLPCLEILAASPLPAVVPAQPAVVVTKPEVVLTPSELTLEDDVLFEGVGTSKTTDIPVSAGLLRKPVATALPSVRVGHALSDLDEDLLVWMEEGFRKYIKLAGRKECSGPWSHRLAQVALGLDVMARGSDWVKSVFEPFTGALFGLMDSARSVQDLEKLDHLMTHSVYLDVLAEIANFKTKNDYVSNNVQGYYEDRYLSMGAT